MAPNFFEGDVVRLSNVYLYLNTDEQVNAFHVQLDGIPAATDADVLEDLAEFVENAYEALVGVMPTDVTHDRIEVKNVTTGAVFGSLPRIAALDGTENTSGPMPPQVTGLVVFPTLVSRVQGRIYLPSFAESANGDTGIETGARNAMDSFAEELLDPFTGVNGTEIAYVVLRGNGTPVLPSSYRVITRFRTQRRRTIGRGS